MGVVFGVLGIGLALIETKLGEATVKVIAAVIWFAVSGICFISRRALPSEPATDSLTSTRSIRQASPRGGAKCVRFGSLGDGGTTGLLTGSY